MEFYRSFLESMYVFRSEDKTWIKKVKYSLLFKTVCMIDSTSSFSSFVIAFSVHRFLFHINSLVRKVSVCGISDKVGGAASGKAKSEA